ncbi:MAG: hypothetical protein AMXMBFR58_12860 [Phycisphaerae bacterium]
MLVVAMLATGALVSCSQPAGTDERAAPTPSGPTVRGPTMNDQKPVDMPGLHNVVAYHEGFYSGSVPEGREGFQTLAAMGVKTIISVDGAAPDVELARKEGIRYIHLPIGYNGFEEGRKAELVRATRDAMKNGPVYMHCHHGKHRSAGAAGAVAVSLGWATPAEMVERMKVSGTAPGYEGLYACTANASVMSVEEIDAVAADFPEVSQPTGFVKGMVEIEEVHEHLLAIQKAGWRVPKDHPDLVPAAEAGRMADLLRVLGASERSQREGSEFTAWLIRDGEHAARLEDMLVAGETDAETLSAQFRIVTASCKECHVKYRD